MGLIGAFQAVKPGGETVKEEITSSRTWTVPEGVTEIFVQVFGGGSGGDATARGSGISSYPGAGGSGGHMAMGVFTVTPGTQYTITIGAGGTGGKRGTAPGAGGKTSFGSLISAAGADAPSLMVSGNGGTSGGAGGDASSNGASNNYNHYAGNASYGGAGGGGGNIYNTNTYTGYGGIYGGSTTSKEDATRNYLSLAGENGVNVAAQHGFGIEYAKYIGTGTEYAGGGYGGNAGSGSHGGGGGYLANGGKDNKGTSSSDFGGGGGGGWMGGNGGANTSNGAGGGGGYGPNKIAGDGANGGGKGGLGYGAGGGGCNTGTAGEGAPGICIIKYKKG